MSTELNDDTIKKIADAVKTAHISDRWKNPKKAEFWGGLGWYIAFVAVMASFVAIAGALLFSDWDEAQQTASETYKTISLANMDCESLRQTMLDLEKSKVNYLPSYDVEKQIISRCN